MAKANSLFREDQADESVASDGNELAGGGGGSISASGAGIPPAKSEFTIPDAPPKKEEPKPPVIGTTEDGCPPRVDRPGNLVIIQSQIVTDGVPDGNCTDTTIKAVLQKSYTTCADSVDQEGMVAHPTYRRYWVDRGGTTQFIDGECVEDEDITYTLSESEEGCRVDVDVDKVYMRAEIVYTNRDNSQVVVRGCQRSATIDPVVLVETACGDMRHNFDTGKSYEQSKKTYAYKAVAYTARACGDSGEALDHRVVNGVCNVFQDLENLIAAPQTRLQVTKSGGGEQYITACAPDLTRQEDLVQTTDTCERSFTHKIDTGQSIQHQRYYHALHGEGDRTYVTSCGASGSEITYEHDLVIMGYEMHDDKLYAFPRQEVYIRNTLAGDILVSPAYVRPGAAQIPYIFARAITTPSGLPNYEGCDKYQPTEKKERYTRPGSASLIATTYDKVIGEGEPLGPINSCTWEIAKNFPMVGGITISGRSPWCSQSSGGIYPTCQYYRSEKLTVACKFKATCTKVREDGKTMGLPESAQQTISKSFGKWDLSQAPIMIQTNSRHCTDPAPGSQRSNIINLLGWN